MLGSLHAGGDGVPKDLSRAAQLMSRACDLGSARGCSQLGSMYATGEGVPKDPTRAAALFKQACEKGLTKACEWAAK